MRRHSIRMNGGAIGARTALTALIVALGIGVVLSLWALIWDRPSGIAWLSLIVIIGSLGGHAVAAARMRSRTHHVRPAMHLLLTACAAVGVIAVAVLAIASALGYTSTARVAAITGLAASVVALLSTYAATQLFRTSRTGSRRE